MGFLSTVPSADRHEELNVNDFSTTVYGSSLAGTGVPRFEMPENEMPARTAQRFIKDDLLLDAAPALNLASFVTTYMEPEIEQLMMEHLNVNFIVDAEEYPASADIETRCVNMIARLFNAPLDNPEAEALGVSTIGSSEAIILSVLAAKRRWRNMRKAQGKSTENPNIVMNAAVQVCWEKAARYLEVEERYWYCKPGQYVLDPKEAVELVDENTIMVAAILGTTYTGQYEDIESLNTELEKKNAETGWDVHIHVDAASGGFVAPFVVPELKWDFRLPLVCSINTSGHKYGLTYAGVGWAVWRNKSFLPEEILFTVNYLGSPQVSFTLNFSKSAVQVIGQYYQLLRLGKAGYRAIMTNLTRTADYLADEILKIGGGNRFELLSEKSGKGLPLVAWRFKGQEKYDEFAIARTLRERGWIVPAYTMAPHTETMKLLRVVVREDFSKARCETFLRDLRDAIHTLDATPQVVLDHKAEAHVETHEKKKKHSLKHHRKDNHSLQGKNDKTHAVC
ncbi:glutamate decarboxylase [Clavulina sp. PMI_390]|nr:glutamate decarboxylase [Clavulina sp. PMI_390]